MSRKRKILPTPDAPTSDLVRSYINDYQRIERFMRGDDAIQCLVRQFPQSRTLYEVLAKVCVINNLYSTGIAATFEMAEHIIRKNVDDALTAGDIDVVDKISYLTIGGRTRHNYSFATKYCAWHQPEHYPIFDNFVRLMFIAYKDKDKFATFEGEGLRRYSEFKRVFCEFKNYYQLKEFSYRELDLFLWGYGKELFPPQYKKTT